MNEIISRRVAFVQMMLYFNSARAFELLIAHSQRISIISAETKLNRNYSKSSIRFWYFSCGIGLIWRITYQNEMPNFITPIIKWSFWLPCRRHSNFTRAWFCFLSALTNFMIGVFLLIIICKLLITYFLTYLPTEMIWIFHIDRWK